MRRPLTKKSNEQRKRGELFAVTVLLPAFSLTNFIGEIGVMKMVNNGLSRVCPTNGNKSC